jgi:hypothetical protein
VDDTTIVLGAAHIDPYGEDRLPLTALTVEEHIHGLLEIRIAGVPIPQMGFFGPDDVCVDTWFVELLTARHVLLSGDPSAHVFDEAEQGQPAFAFRRRDDTVTVTVEESLIGGGRAIPDLNPSCLLPAFTDAVDAFESDLADRVGAIGPVGLAWLADRQAQAVHAIAWATRFG